MKNDRAAMELVLDQHMKGVVEYMENALPNNKLVAVAERLPEIARLLWGHFEQEPCVPLKLSPVKTAEQSPSQQVSTELGRSPLCADGDSVVEAACR